MSENQKTKEQTSKHVSSETGSDVREETPIVDDGTVSPPSDPFAEECYEIAISGKPVREYCGKSWDLKNTIKQKVLAGEIPGEAIASKKVKYTDGKWRAQISRVDELAFLRAFFRPMRHRLVRGLQVCLALGIGWEVLFQGRQFIIMEKVGPAIGYGFVLIALAGIIIFNDHFERFMNALFPIFIISLFAGGISGSKTNPGEKTDLFSKMTRIIEALVPSIAAVVISLFSGAVLGCSSGLAVGGFWALYSRRRAVTAPAPLKESPSKYRLLAVIASIVFVGYLFVYCQWARKWPVDSETSLREERLQNEKSKPASSNASNENPPIGSGKTPTLTESGGFAYLIPFGWKESEKSKRPLFLRDETRKKNCFGVY